MRTPVALFVFNRPDVTRKVFERIAAVRPEVLLIVADGPRADRPDDAALCAEVRRIVTAVDWPCDLRVNFAPRNLGCGLRVSTGLDWVFRLVEEAIVLEDDCLPAPDFFPFCEAMLDRYRHDTRIGIVCGSNFANGEAEPDGDYLFCRYGPIWGWATWRRTWRFYDFAMSTYDEDRGRGLLSDLFTDRKVVRFWERAFDEYAAGRIDTWDYALTYATLRQSMLHVIPAVNLITNIGCGRPDATHTRDPHPVAEWPSGSLHFPLRHPSAVVASLAFERSFERRVFGIRHGMPDPAEPKD
ncbi:hemolytic protein HlpA-like protein [Azospirillum thermophilum]|uniref:Hemolytic protein HlpA-like protein n=1 Tax=Azospirillum thermophilum TaxID=2202148 RepID=A0A2S2D0U1_9PROT|nr:hemolytic protein HlpA-like protein [Azospirillum thermophilum]AWK90260.1 hemolytic protein HlpA-like protein [Azospirillum thermophilum]